MLKLLFLLNSERHLLLLFIGFILLVATLFFLTVVLFVQRRKITFFSEEKRKLTFENTNFIGLIESIAVAIDARDQVGSGHIRRTQIYAVGIGELLGLSEGEISALRTGALLHDIGKLAVPDHILNKPGRLTPAEMEKTKIHAAVSASILEKVDFSYPVVPTVKHHHETWDGSGYPDGLKGENIPITARILTVADAYDTLRGARSYRPSVSRDDARRFLLNGAGIQFDPKIVDVFLRNLKKFETEVDAQNYSYPFDKGSLDDVHNVLEDDPNQSFVEQIKRANREVFTLYELARVFNSSLHLHETLVLFARKIGELVPFDTCVIYLLDETEKFAKAAYVEGDNSSALKNKIVKPGEGATGYVLKKRQAVHNIEPGLDFAFSEFGFDQDYTAMASLPLISDEKLLGAVSLYSSGLENYEEEPMRLLETVARIASDAIFMAQQHAQSESRGLTDPVTELPNARSLQMQFEKEVARATRSGNDIHLLTFYLNDIKKINNTFGLQVGDLLLKQISKVINSQLIEMDFLARYSGYVFVAILNYRSNTEVGELCQRLENAVSEFRLPIGDSNFIQIGVSVVAPSYPKDGLTLEAIILAAKETQ